MSTAPSSSSAAGAAPAAAAAAPAKPAVRSQLVTQTKPAQGIDKVLTNKACPPAGPYTQAMKAGGMLYVSGQIPADPRGNIVSGTIGHKTRVCAQNIKAILEAAGSAMNKVVKVTVFLDDMKNFAEMNLEYERHFTHRPARSCVAVKGLPKGVPVEIECIAVA